MKMRTIDLCQVCKKKPASYDCATYSLSAREVANSLGIELDINSDYESYSDNYIMCGQFEPAKEASDE